MPSSCHTPQTPTQHLREEYYRPTPLTRLEQHCAPVLPHHYSPTALRLAQALHYLGELIKWCQVLVHPVCVGWAVCKSQGCESCMATAKGMLGDIEGDAR